MVEEVQIFFESVVEKESLSLLNSEEVFLPSDEEFSEEQVHVIKCGDS